MLFLTGISHNSATIEERERLALSNGDVSRLLDRLRSVDGVSERFALSTCNRLEIYIASNDPSAIERSEQALCALRGVDFHLYQEIRYRKDGAAALQHLFEVACGLDSQLVGETEIQGQVKAAYSLAAEERATGPKLHHALQKALQASKYARTHTDIGSGQVSVGNVSASLARRIFGSLADRSALVVGSGEIGEQTAQALKSRGVGEIRTTSRSLEKARALAARIGGAEIPFDEWQSMVGMFDIVLCATAAPSVSLSAEIVQKAMQKRPLRPLFLIDLALPRDIAPAAADIENVFVYNLDDLAEIANESLALRMGEVDHCREILRARAERAWAVIGDASLRPKR